MYLILLLNWVAVQQVAVQAHDIPQRAGTAGQQKSFCGEEQLFPGFNITLQVSEIYFG